MHLGQQRQDGDASMAADHWHLDLARVHAGDLGHKRLGPDDVQRGHAKQPAGVVGAGSLEHLVLGA